MSSVFNIAAAQQAKAIGKYNQQIAERILRYNAEQAEVEKNIMSYNAKIGQQRKFEEANFARMRGSLARMEAKSAELGYYAKAGESLLRMYG